MDDMLYLPDDLYSCLKDTVSKEPSPSILEHHLPAIRDVILKLLQGLKRKQSLLRERFEPTTNSNISSLTQQQQQQPLDITVQKNIVSPIIPLPSPSASFTTATTATAATTTTTTATTTTTEPLSHLFEGKRNSVPQSPISPIRNSSSTSSSIDEVDLDDPSTKDAMSKLALQGNLANRSSVRRTSYYPSYEHIPLNPEIMDIYLKKGAHVKKSFIHQKDVSLHEIRQLFYKSFNLDSNNTTFIYILDPISNIEYELEDISDIKPYSILIMKENEDNDFHSLDPSMTKKLEILFKDVMQQVIENIANKKPRMSDETTIRKELNTLRHELANVRQIYEEYKKETEKVIDELKEKSTKVTSTKSLVVMLDERTRAEMNESREVTQKAAMLITNRLEELQDMIDQLKIDVTQRRRRPPKNQLHYCQEESKKLEIEMNELQQRIKEFKPIWKKTWEVELQRIVKEQQFLKEQEALLTDLKDDRNALLQVLEQLEKISEIHERKKQLGREYRMIPSTVDEEGGMAGVMKQVSTIHVDHSRRVKALAEAEKLRAKELSQRIDAFERELTGFVELRKLKKTGGAEAIEKQRQEKDKALIKQIFVNDVTQNNNSLPVMKENNGNEYSLTPIPEEDQNKVCS
ncbi:actin interacting protein 3-domain-containing protein [Cokeromyces recurvatus]|uniref:actin interacting protein 3-domain-containing protein n=1 Tax=Cokeromyces recurvatus TaxID=90255 RepID=UPI00221FC521|nr:actin interacting protein 3-domain-containing protein [Cokeromyces recurvatus]KAI7898326.1 actin interacting protein 3-domain-containing protein [Cokeromyces recurvatus]